MSPYNVWLWEPAGFMSRWAGSLWENETLLLKGMHINSHAPSPSTEGSMWKVPGPYIKEIRWLILWEVPKGQESVGAYSGDRSAGGCYFFFFSLLLPIWSHWQTPFLTFAIYLANTTDPTPTFPWGPTHPTHWPWLEPLQSSSCFATPAGCLSRYWHPSKAAPAAPHQPSSLG